MKRKEKLEKLGEIFCRWNDRTHPQHLDSNEAAYEIFKVFHVETLRAWHKYCDEKETRKT